MHTIALAPKGSGTLVTNQVDILMLSAKTVRRKNVLLISVLN